MTNISGVVLAVLRCPAAAPAVLAAAGNFAALAPGSRVNVLGLSQPPESAILPSEEVLTHHQEQRLRSREQARLAALRTAFDQWNASRRGNEPPCTWYEAEAPAEAAVTEWGSRADFLVIRRPAPGDPESERRAAHAALFDTHRPVLMVPPDFTAPFGRVVAIAWRDDHRAIKAVLAGLRCLSRAQEIHVLAGRRDAAPAPRLPQALAEHGIDANLHVLPIGPGVFGAALLAKAHALGADLLVMGAYARSPLREAILGGVTRHMLMHADIPVLMRH